MGCNSFQLMVTGTTMATGFMVDDRASAIAPVPGSGWRAASIFAGVGADRSRTASHLIVALSSSPTPSHYPGAVFSSVSGG
jgi:hypothetical protein